MDGVAEVPAGFAVFVGFAQVGEPGKEQGGEHHADADGSQVK